MTVRSLVPVSRSVVCGAICLGGLMAAQPAHAGKRIFSYDPANDSARTLADGGFTFVFEDGLFRGQTVKTILSTHDEAEAALRRADEKELGAGMEALAGRKLDARGLYEIVQDGHGAPLVRAVCPGAVRAWLAFGELDRNRDLTVQVFGRAVEGGETRHCTTLEFRYRGEWKLPGDPGAMRATLGPRSN